MGRIRIPIQIGDGLVRQKYGSPGNLGILRKRVNEGGLEVVLIGSKS